MFNFGSYLCVLSLLSSVLQENLLVKISFLYHAPMKITFVDNQQKFDLSILDRAIYTG